LNEIKLSQVFKKVDELRMQNQFAEANNIILDLLNKYDGNGSLKKNNKKDLFKIYIKLMDNYILLEDLINAKIYYKKLKKLKSSYEHETSSQYIIADYYLNIGEYTEALKILEKTLDSNNLNNDDNSGFNFLLFKTYKSVEKYTKASFHLEKSFEYDRDFENSILGKYWKALILRDLKKYKESALFFEQCIDNYDNNEEDKELIFQIYFYLIECHLNLKNIDEAENQYKYLIKIPVSFEDQIEALFLKAKISKEKGDLKSAEKIYLNILNTKNITNNIYSYHYELSLIYIDIEELDKAENHLIKGLEYSEMNEEWKYTFYNELGILYNDLGKFEDARIYLLKALKIKPNEHWIRLTLSATLLSQNRNITALYHLFLIRNKFQDEEYIDSYKFAYKTAIQNLLAVFFIFSIGKHKNA